jgi:iron complex outermembrane receptor protein
MKKLFFLCITISLFLGAQAQTKERVRLSGTVTDTLTGTPLAGASVVLSDTRMGTVTNSNGYYELNNVPTGHTILEISYTGYNTRLVHLDVSRSTVQNIGLGATIVVNEGITVTAVAGATSIRKAPIPIERVNKQELLLTPSTNIIDALSRQPGVSQLSTGPAISKPIIRGLGYNRLVVINDGARQEGQQWGDEHGIEIDENSVSRIEIVKGPASLIYGSDAMAGVINILTTQPVPEGTIKGNVLTSYQTNNKQRSFFGSIGGNRNGFNWNIWGDYTAAADYKNKYDGPVYNSKFTEGNFGGYAGYNGAWGFSHFIVSSFNQELGVIEGDRNAYGAFVKAWPGGLETVATSADFNSIHPQVPYQQVQHLKFILDNSFRVANDKLTLNFAWQSNQRREFGNVDDPAEQSLHFDLKTFNYSAAYHFHEINGWAPSFGINGMAQANTNKGVEVLIPAYHLFDAGGFLYLQKTAGKSTISGGVRFDNRVLHADKLEEGGDVKFTDIKTHFSNFSGSAGISYAASDNLLLKLNLARGFRAPSVPELASNGTHEGTNRYEYGNPDLKSESSWQGDAGVQINSDHVLFTANAFYNSISNFIFYSKLKSFDDQDSLVAVDGDLIPTYRFGQRNAHLYGGELLVDIHPHPLDWLHWQNTVSYVKAQFVTPIEGVRNVPFIPATRWISELRGEFLKDGKTMKNLSLHFEVDHTFEQNHPFTAFETETATPAYTLLNTSISTDFVSKGNTLFSVYFLANNLADVAWQSHLSRLKYAAVNGQTGRVGVFNSGRNFMIKLNIPLVF